MFRLHMSDSTMLKTMGFETYTNELETMFAKSCRVMVVLAAEQSAGHMIVRDDRA